MILNQSKRGKEFVRYSRRVLAATALYSDDLKTFYPFLTLNLKEPMNVAFQQRYAMQLMPYEPCRAW